MRNLTLRKASLLATLPLVALLVAAGTLWFQSTPARAASARSTSLLAAPHHDMSHPMRENYPCAGMPRSGVAHMGQTPVFQCASSTTRGVSPYAGNGAGNCYNGQTYLQYHNGVGQFWGNASNGNYPSEYQMTGWIEYFWCPRYAGDSVGINYSYGEVYPQAMWGGTCPFIMVGGPVTVIGGDRNYYGAGMQQQSGPYINDGESPYHGWTICPGNYVYDYSNISSGQYHYDSVMWVGDSANFVTGHTWLVGWPVFQ